MKRLLVQCVNRKDGTPVSMIPDLVKCGDIHSYVDEHLSPEVVITISSLSEYDEADVRKDEPCQIDE